MHAIYLKLFTFELHFENILNHVDDLPLDSGGFGNAVEVRLMDAPLIFDKTVEFDGSLGLNTARNREKQLPIIDKLVKTH